VAEDGSSPPARANATAVGANVTAVEANATAVEANSTAVGANATAVGANSSSRSGPRCDYDVAVIGGGLIGAAAALGLARLARRVLLIEPAPPAAPPARHGLDIRTVAMSPASRELLESLGVWSSIVGAPYRRMEVWEERGTAAMVFDAAEVGRAELGWIVENGAAAAALWEVLRQQEQLTVCADEVEHVGPAEDAVTLEAGGRTLTARLVIAADGAQSMVRRRLGVAVSTHDVGHVAIATLARTARPHQGVAYQRFLLDGPVALLPTRDPHASSVVWSQSPGEAERRRGLTDAAFCAELTRAVQGCLGAVVAVDRRVAFPLQQLLAATFNPHPRVLLIGDAARVLHPLAGLGANVGFEDVRDLLAVLERVPVAGDAGAYGLWRGYDRQRSARARMMVALMDTLRRTYAQGDPLRQWLRNVGVAWLNRMTPIKRQIMMEAMGLGPVGRGGSASAGGS
jgi:2-polyprenylphenol 6-hydroxylase